MVQEDQGLWASQTVDGASVEEKSVFKIFIKTFKIALIQYIRICNLEIVP